MYLYFLGTSASVPSRDRNMSGTALVLCAERGTFWLIDCAEGTQHQLLRSPLRLSKLEKLFVTHLHGDHIYGIPGLLSSRAAQAVTRPLAVYGPPGIRDFIQHGLSTRQSPLSYGLQIEEIASGLVYKDSDFTVTAQLLEHGIASYGYRFQEQDRPGHIRTDKLREFGIPEGPILQLIKKGQSIVLPDGRTIAPEDLVGPVRRGRCVVICGDTVPTAQTIELAKDADVLVHEATFAMSESAHAWRKFHSTTQDAARLARDANVKTLIMTHISVRYDQAQCARLVEEAMAVFENTHLAHDHWQFEVVASPRLHQIEGMTAPPATGM